MTTTAFPFPIIEAGSNRDLLSIPIERVKSTVQESGAVLFRGFDLDTEKFSTWSKLFMTQPFVHGYTPLDPVTKKDPSRKVELPQGGRVHITADATVTTVNIGKAGLHLHADAAFLPTRPDLCFFYCIRPADKAGETTLGDGTVIPDALTPRIKDLFARNRIMFKLRFGKSNWARSLGVDKREDVVPIFDFLRLRAESRGEALRVLFRDQAPQFFHDNVSDAENLPDADDVYAEYVTPALPKRRDGKRVFASHFHNAARFGNAPGRKVPSAVETAEMFKSFKSDVWACFESGETIPDEALDDLEAACARCEVPIAWNAAEVVMIDNWRIPHGRRAYEDLKRTIYTTFGYCDFVEQVSPQS